MQKHAETIVLQASLNFIQRKIVLFYFILNPLCPRCAQMHPRRRGRHCLTASSMNSLFVLTVRFRQLLRFISVVPSVTLFRNNLFKPDSVHGLLGNSAMSFLVPYDFCCLNSLIKDRSSVENTVFIVHDYCVNSKQRHFRTSNCSHCTGNQNILSLIFAQEFTFSGHIFNTSSLNYLINIL